jgi:hypothetical protein
MDDQGLAKLWQQLQKTTEFFKPYLTRPLGFPHCVYCGR